MARFRWGAVTDVGRLRSANEDAYSVADGVFVVADGMGGHLAGEVASAMAVEILQHRLGAVANPIESVVAAVEDANLRIFEASHTRVDQHGMGTTLVALAVVRTAGETRLGLVNVGDSRAYAIRNGRLRQISVDHSYVQELISSGQLTADEARTHPHRNIVTRALGIEPVVHIDAWTLPLTVGDRFILCSDGLVDEVIDATIAEIATVTVDPQEAAERMVAIANRQGGRDNITVVVVDVLHGAEPITEELQLAADGRWGGTTDQWADDSAPDGIAAPGAEAADLPTGRLRIVPANAAADDITGVLARPSSTSRADDRTATHSRVAEPLATMPTGGLPPPTPGSDPAIVTGSSGTAPRRRSLISRMFGGLSLSSIGFATAVAAVFVVAFVLIAAYARTGYFVDYRNDDVVVYKGRPGGVLWFDPTVEAISTHKRPEFTPEVANSIANRPTFDDPVTAIDYIERLADQSAVLGEPPVTVTAPVTVPAPATVVGEAATTAYDPAAGGTTVPTTAITPTTAVTVGSSTP